MQKGGSRESVIKSRGSKWVFPGQGEKAGCPVQSCGLWAVTRF